MAKIIRSSSSDDDPSDENLKEELDQINTKLDSVVEELAKITALIVDLQGDVLALLKE
jgi:ABC-type phosphate transport system auxiliary subunit